MDADASRTSPFPSWLHHVSFAGRTKKEYTAAAAKLASHGVCVFNWSGGKASAPSALLLDLATAAAPPKKVERAREFGVPVVDVLWVARCIDEGRPVDHAEYTAPPPSTPAATLQAAAAAQSRKRQACRVLDDTDSSSSEQEASFADSLMDGDVDDDMTGRSAADTCSLLPHRSNPSAPWWERSTREPARAPWVGVGASSGRTAPRKSTGPPVPRPPVPRRSVSARTKAPELGGAAHAKDVAHAVRATPAAASVAPATSKLQQMRLRRRQPTTHELPDAAGSSGDSKSSDREDRDERAAEERPAAGRKSLPMQREAPARSLPPAKRQRPNAAPGAAAPKRNLVDRAADKRKGESKYDKPWLNGAKIPKGEEEAPPADPIMKQLKENETTKHIPGEILAGIRNEILDPKQLAEQGVTFDDVHGLQEAKKTLFRSVILPRKNPRLFTGLRKPTKGLLLFGPPGNGKTMLAKAVAAQCNLTFFNISASALTSKMVGDGEKNVKALFACARALAPSFVFLDEIDSLLTTRGGGGTEHEASRRLKTEFLVQLDGAGAENNQVLVMAATNRPMDLDDAVLRRLEKRVYVPLPNYETRLEYCKRTLQQDVQIKLEFTEETWLNLAQSTKDYSFCDLANLCRELALAPLDDCLDLSTADIEDLRPINDGDVDRQTQKIRKSVSDDLLKQLLKWNEEMGTKCDA
eukprot:Rhum_TRINITY_DN132_c0_g2::Rhum_TRINITY_DN132_c0_g2_i1::g.410::m.410/K13254/SPAST; spastin